MAFDSLSEKLQNVFKKLRGKGRLSEADVREAVKEVKIALLEADVNFKVVKNFINTVRARIYKGFHTEAGSDPQCIFFRVEHESCARLIENELWDKLYDDAFKDIVTDVRPV